MPHLFLLASLGTFLYSGVTLMVLECSYILSHTLTVFIILFVDKALFNAKYPIRLSLVWHTLYISWPLIPRVILGLLNNQLDRLFIGGILGPAILAVYAIAQSISISVFQFMTALGRIFQPQIYRICFGKQPMENLEKWSLPFLNLTLAFAALISIISDYMISYTLPQAYDGAQLVVLILINTYVLCFAAKINGIQLSVAKKFGFTVASIGINIIVYVGLLYPLHEKFSLAGVGLAFFVSQLCGNSFLFFVAQKFCHLPLSLIQIVSRHVLFILIFLLVHSFRHEQEISIKLCVDLIVAVCLAVWIIRTKSLKAIL
jgi:O-antigen/teichoic acid export membrane protein